MELMQWVKIVFEYPSLHHIFNYFAAILSKKAP